MITSLPHGSDTAAPRRWRTGGITSLSRRHARRLVSSHSRNPSSFERQIRTSCSRRLSQVTAMPSRDRPGLAPTNASSTSSGVRCCGRAAAPAPGRIPGSHARIAATSHARRRKMAALRIAPAGAFHARPPSRRTTATRTATAHRNRIARAGSAGDPARAPIRRPAPWQGRRRATNERETTNETWPCNPPHSTGRTKSVGLARGQEHYKNKMAIKGTRN